MEGLIWINENLHSSNIFNHVVKFITTLGDGGVFWIIFALVLLFFRKTRMCGFVMLISLGVGYVINDFILKEIFARVRPFNKNAELMEFLKSINLEAPKSYSFPSGHAYSSFNCAVIITCFNKKLGCFAVPMATLIALSRVFLCVHYPTDVLVGIILGIVTALVVYVIYKSILRQIKANKRKRILLESQND